MEKKYYKKGEQERTTVAWIDAVFWMNLRYDVDKSGQEEPSLSFLWFWLLIPCFLRCLQRRERSGGKAVRASSPSTDDGSCHPRRCRRCHRRKWVVPSLPHMREAPTLDPHALLTQSLPTLPSTLTDEVCHFTLRLCFLVSIFLFS